MLVVSLEGIHSEEKNWRKIYLSMKYRLQSGAMKIKSIWDKNFLSFLPFTFRYSKSVTKKNNCKNENVSLIVFPTLFLKYLLPTKWIIPWYCHKFSISYSGNKIYCKSKKLIFLECLSDLSRNMAHMSAYFSPRSSKHYHGISFYFFQNVQFDVTW